MKIPQEEKYLTAAFSCHRGLIADKTGVIRFVHDVTCIQTKIKIQLKE